MEILRKIKSKITQALNLKKKEEPFYTKDIFKDRKFKIGEYTYGHPIILFENEGTNLHIGKFCSIAGGVTIFLGGNHRTDWITTFPFGSFSDMNSKSANIKGHPATKGDVIIKNDVWIGFNVTIMSGVVIGNGAVIASGSVVVKDIGAYEIWGGNPAKFIRKRFDNDKIQLLEKSQWWDWEKEKIMSNVQLLCSSNFNDFLNLK